MCAEPHQISQQTLLSTTYAAHYCESLTELANSIAKLQLSKPFVGYATAEPIKVDRDTILSNWSLITHCKSLIEQIHCEFQENLQLDQIDIVDLEDVESLHESVRSEHSNKQEMARKGSNASHSKMRTQRFGSNPLSFEFRDVVPVKGKKAAKALNDEVIKRIQAALENDDEFDRFKALALDFGRGSVSATDFYAYLLKCLPLHVLSPIILDFARLLPNEDQRIPLLQAHMLACAQWQQADVGSPVDNKTANCSRRSTSLASSDSFDSDDDRIEELPTTLRLSTINHLIFIIHGIGQHVDFRDGEFKSWNGQSGLEGENHNFRELFRSTMYSTFREIPLALEIKSIEWHEDLHKLTGVDTVFDHLCPEGSQGIREFNKETLMDVLYYLSPRYGQLIINSVTAQLNSKYSKFMEEHPGWDGHVSIFAHSLGSVIAYDILSHQDGEVANNGVVFSSLNFAVENVFAAGSPVPVMVLGRGNVDTDENGAVDGVRMPVCNHYYNIFHPIDPIAYRIEPLIKQEMHKVPPVQIISATTARGVSFARLQEMLEAITSPIHGFPSPRIDYVMKRRARETTMMELAFATASHSSYWLSEDVVTFAIMQLCRPVMDKLRHYLSAQIPLPLLSRNHVELTPHTDICLSGNALVRDQCTGFSHERVLLMDHDRLYIISSLADAICRRRWRITLSSHTKAVCGEDPLAVKIIPDTVNGVSRFSESHTTQLSPNADSVPVLLKAPSTAIRDEWIAAINSVIASCTGKADSICTSKRKHETRIHLPADKCIDFFSAVKTGTLQGKAPKGWYEVWSNRWVVLQENALSCYDSAPKLETIIQIKLRRTRIHSYETGHLFRIISRMGSLVELRVRDPSSFNRWLDAFAQVHSCVIFRHNEVLGGSTTAALTAEEEIPVARNSNELLIQTKIDGYQLAFDEKGLQYATFVIQVFTSNCAVKVVHRRHSDFKKLHQSLKKLCMNPMPPLPDSRVWNKLEPTYLKQKAVRLHGYLDEACKRCDSVESKEILMNFLEIGEDNASEDSE